MKAIVNAIRTVVEIFTTAWGFVESLIENLISFIKYLGIAAKMGFEMIIYLPAPIQIFGTICIFGSLLFLIVGRSTGGKKGGE